MRSPNNSSSVRERKELHRYTFVVVPDAKSEKTRTFSVTRWGLASITIAIVTALVVIVVAVIVLTPFGSYLPISNTKLERQYGQQIVNIQNQMQTLVQGVNRLREYNLRLRRAMGEKIPPPSDTAGGLIASQVSGENLTAQSLAGSPVVGVRQATPPSVRNVVVPAVDYRSWGGRLVSHGLPLSMPVDGFVSRGFDPVQSHYGIDFAGKPGSPILAAADGSVVFAGWTYEDGFTVAVLHSDGYLTVYKHNQSILQHEGEPVRRGDVLALLGNTGQTSHGPHLHFEVWKDGIAQNPSDYLLTDK